MWLGCGDLLGFYTEVSCAWEVVDGWEEGADVSEPWDPELAEEADGWLLELLLLLLPLLCPAELARELHWCTIHTSNMISAK